MKNNLAPRLAKEMAVDDNKEALRSLMFLEEKAQGLPKEGYVLT